MSIIDFPPNINDFSTLRFPEIWARETEQQIEFLLNQNLQDFDELQSFVKVQIEKQVET